VKFIKRGSRLFVRCAVSSRVHIQALLIRNAKISGDRKGVAHKQGSACCHICGEVRSRRKIGESQSWQDMSLSMYSPRS
jgi:hypothetical protein